MVAGTFKMHLHMMFQLSYKKLPIESHRNAVPFYLGYRNITPTGSENACVFHIGNED